MWKRQPDGGLIGLGTSPCEDDPLAPRVRIGERHRREQRLGIGMQRRRRRVRRLLRELDDLAEIHDRDAVADVLDHREVVRDEQVGELQLLLQVAAAG